MLRICLKAFSVLFVTAALWGCKAEEKAEVPPPRDVPAEAECAVDGMIVANYPGPKAQIHYRGGKAPEFFCETKEMFMVYLEPGRKAEITAVYVQDTAEVDWAKPVDAWIDAKSALYVIGGSLKGSMGPTYAPFSRREDALKFIEKYGGEIKTFDELLKEMGQ